MAYRILIIEDEEAIAKSLQKLLAQEGYDVTIAWGGSNALEKVREKDFHLIICDIRMPDVDGIETIKAIRDYLKEQVKRPIPEIFITGYADEEKYKAAVNLKVAGYLHKPFDTTDFLEIISKTLNT